MDNPLISVLIPTYNVEKFVEEAVNSILNQTYTNLEIIVVDDGSTDATYAKLSSLQKKDARIKIFRNSENKRIVETLNTALSIASGSFIARMDGDDISTPDRIEKMYNFLKANEEVDLVGSNVLVVNEEGVEIHKAKYLENHQDIVEVAGYISPILHIWLAKKALYDDVGNYRISTVEDYDFILRCIDAGKKLANIPDYVYIQRIRSGNTATSMGLIQRKLFNYARELHKERKRSKSQKDSFSFAMLEKIKKDNMDNRLFSISSSFHNKYIQLKSTNKLSAILNLCLAIIISPIQLGQIIRRFKYKQKLKRTIQI